VDDAHSLNRSPESAPAGPAAAPAGPLAADWALDLLRHARVGRLATADGAGRPLVVPVCYVFDGHLVWTAVDAKPKRTKHLRRLRNIDENRHVSLVVDQWDEDWSRLSYVIVEGTAEVLDRQEETSPAIALLLEKYPQYRVMGLDREPGTVIRITPARLIAWRP
jgi:PPOX class probable F420-dependent enzyme